MVAPASKFARPAGRAEVEVAVVSGQSAVTHARATSPLRILAPRPRGESAWVYLSSLGGGYLAGDETELKVQVRSRATIFLSTQALTKVYRNPSDRPCGHQTVASIESDGFLCFAPDPVQAFTGSSYRQNGRYDLASTANLVLLDWYSCGRHACGERWDFTAYSSRNEIRVDGQPILIDALSLRAADGLIASAHRTGRFHCLATLAFVGPALCRHVDRLLQDIAARAVRRQEALLCTASALRGGGIIRVAGCSAEAVGQELSRFLKPLQVFLGDDPWQRKW